MLVLSRRLNEKFLLPGINTSVQVVAIKPGVVRLGIEAPPEVAVLREELEDRAAEWRPTQPSGGFSGETRAQALDHLTRQGLKSAGIQVGLARLQLLSGETRQAQATLDQIHEEIQALRRRLEGKEKEPMPRPRKMTPAKAAPTKSEVLASCPG